MDVNAIIDGILERKEATGMTYQQIADASGVPRTTVSRILQKQTPNPSVKNIADIAVAVGYDIDPVRPPVLQGSTRDAYILFLQESLAAERAQAEKKYLAQEARHNRQLAEKNRWIASLAVALILVLTFLVGWLIVDITHPTVGWIQRALSRQFAGTDFLLRSVVEHLFGL